MNRDAMAEALLIEVSRWQRLEAERLGAPLVSLGEPVKPAHRGTCPLSQGKTQTMTTTPTPESPAELAAVATIAAAFFASRSNVNVADVGPVVLAIRVALTSPANYPAVEEPAPELKPAVPVRKSVTDDFIICLEDGKKFKSLKRHLRTHYDLSPEDYRAKWSLPADYPMVAPSYSATRSKLAKDNGLGTKGVTH